MHGCYRIFQRFTTQPNSEFSGGLPFNEVRLTDYCAQWPEQYRVESQRIAEALYPFSISLAHIGSTAIPGLTAKPIIDILLGLQEPVHSIPVQLTLQGMGYRPHGEKGVPGRLFFTAGDPARFHLHLVEYKGSIWKNHLFFRDRLIDNPKLAAQYVKLKRELAERFPQDRESYTRGKADFIENVLRANSDND